MTTYHKICATTLVIMLFAVAIIGIFGLCKSCGAEPKLPNINSARFEIIEDAGKLDGCDTYILLDKETRAKYIYLRAAGIRELCPLIESNKEDLVEIEDVAEPAPASEPKIDIPIDQYTDVARYLAKTIYGEARGCSTTQQAAVIWCILNRVDTDGKYSPSEVIQVVTAKSQFHGYDPDHPVLDEHYNLAIDVLTRWLKEKAGETNVGRVLPKNYRYFGGDGVKNTFRDSWKGGNRWNWSLPSPYEV